jgi:hypothetical protein
MTDTDGGNAAQIAYWNDRAAANWTALQEKIDALFAPITALALDAAAPAPGETVLDVGCGCGATVLALAERVGPSGRVLGVDVSVPMAARASQRIADAGLAHAEVPGGRLLCAVWRTLPENSWFTVPLKAALPLLPPQPQADPFAPGPFAFADFERVRGLLSAAGWRDISAQPRDVPMLVGGPGQLDKATDFAMRLGALARILSETDPAVHPAVRQAVQTALAGHEGPGGVMLGGSIWLVSARA